MPFFIAFWKPIAGILLVLALVGTVAFAKHRYDERRRDEGRVEVQAKWDAYKAEQIERTTAMTMLWDSKRQEVDRVSADRDKLRDERTRTLASAVSSLPVAVAGVVVPAVAVSVLNAGASAANAAGTPGEPEKTVATSAPSADSTVGRITGWTVLVLDILGECRDRVAEWDKFYADLRAAQPKGVTP
jgi:hypothetical protein